MYLKGMRCCECVDWIEMAQYKA